MIRNASAAAMLCLLAACTTGGEVPIATAEVATFHRMLDAGQFQQIWRNAAPEMKAATGEKALTALLAKVHARLGRVKSADQESWKDQYSTGGHFITLKYTTHFTGGDAAEQFVYKVAYGKATLAGYHVGAEALIAD